LLIRRNTFFVLNLGLHVVDCVRGFNIQSDGFACRTVRQQANVRFPRAKSQILEHLQY
jgi:hypothetical protein